MKTAPQFPPPLNYYKYQGFYKGLAGGWWRWSKKSNELSYNFLETMQFSINSKIYFHRLHSKMTFNYIQSHSTIVFNIQFVVAIEFLSFPLRKKYNLSTSYGKRLAIQTALLFKVLYSKIQNKLNVICNLISFSHNYLSTPQNWKPRKKLLSYILLNKTFCNAVFNYHFLIHKYHGEKFSLVTLSWDLKKEQKKPWRLHFLN